MTVKGTNKESKSTQGHVGLWVDVPPEEVCQHGGLACRGGKQADSQAEKMVPAVSKGTSIFMDYVF